MIVTHVTHEAVEQMGGIGAVISGLVNSDAYGEAVSRTILLGPLLFTDRPVNLRLGEGGQVLYSSLDAIDPPPWREKFRPIERTYDVGIVYGRRVVTDACSGKSVTVEALLLDVFHANRERLNLFKGELYGKFAVPSSEFENVWEYEQYLRLAEPGWEALRAIGCNGADEPLVILAHEYMGMPTALRAVLAGRRNVRTVFYAHEVASVRPIVEDAPGHDTMFYNVLRKAPADGATLEELFPSVFGNFKHALVKAARYCDHVFAVGDFVREELKFLDKHFSRMNIDLVYNGIPAERISTEERGTSRDLLIGYANALFGWTPKWVFSHVCRPVLSKSIWRDLRILHELEPVLKRRGEKAVYFMLGTLAGQRRPADVRQMERVYGWPVRHEHGYPDLCGGEELLGDMFEAFNKDHELIQAVFVNQWGWERQVCGERMPEDMAFADLRRGTDLEFGLSAYEPFGISQFEPLSFGAICVPSVVCGCVGFLRATAGQEEREQNVLVGDFLNVPSRMKLKQLLDMPAETRDAIETAEARRLAGAIAERLSDAPEALKERMERGCQLAERMSWEHVVREYFLPSLGRVASGG